MPSKQIQLTLTFLIALLISIFLDDYNVIDYNDEDDDDDNNMQYRLIANVQPNDIYNKIYGTVWFKHYTGINQALFDYIIGEIGFDVTEARNIHFAYSDHDNYFRKRRKCKITVRNRIINFLHQMRTGEIVHDIAYENGWNASSVSADFFHVLIQFVKRFDSEWIRKMDDNIKDQLLGLFEGYPTAYQALDGVQFPRRKSKRLPNGIRRRELYLYKHKFPEGENVQAVINHFGLATEVLTGIKYFYIHLLIYNDNNNSNNNNNYYIDYR